MLINNDQTPYLTYYRILGLTVHATSTHWFQLPSPRLKWHTEFGHLNRGDMLTSEQHRCSNEKKKF
ncbi:hypothetical protein CSW66_15585 [Shigella boydii]|nr:hypothetical protein [Shigella boydii]EFY2562640.1 hypothetical protein [Shigella flexneri]EFY2687184.1 hypothetical protein [Shigella flexneri]EFY2923460.1 hypothetical protein [Shigella flexneri]EFY8730713.1 hypothetical protein [Shigella flexneri]